MRGIVGISDSKDDMLRLFRTSRKTKALCEDGLSLVNHSDLTTGGPIVPFLKDKTAGNI